jgi:hypothetical protein
MVDPFSLLSFLRDLIEDYTEERVILIGRLSDIEDEPTYKNLKAEGHTFMWSKVDGMRARARKGWRPVVERDRLGHARVFMDTRKELILISKR